MAALLLVLMIHAIESSYRHKKPSGLSATKITNPLLDSGSWTPSNEDSMNLYEFLSPHRQNLNLEAGRGISKSTPVSPSFRRISPGRSVNHYDGPSMIHLNAGLLRNKSQLDYDHRYTPPKRKSRLSRLRKINPYTPKQKDLTVNINTEPLSPKVSRSSRRHRSSQQIIEPPFSPHRESPFASLEADKSSKSLSKHYVTEISWGWDKTSSAFMNTLRTITAESENERLPQMSINPPTPDHHSEMHGNNTQSANGQIQWIQPGEGTRMFRFMLQMIVFMLLILGIMYIASLMI